ncbi:protein usf-like [Acropora palmata]|uniref:protein usf-like n=1 Tax=Acropora palmata TaxID=6131 RepID=UPI003DA12DB3
MLLLEELPGFLTVLLNLHMRFDSVYVQKEPITFTSTNPLGDCPGSLNGAMRNPSKCLIVVQEWWGMNEQIKEQARQIGKMGKFVTLVPDLYRGQVAKTVVEAIHLTSNLDYSGAVKDIQGAAQFLLKSGCKKVGITGFCMGGSLSLAAAVLVPEISAAAPFYGIPPASLADVSTIKIPLQCHFGKNDTSNTANPEKYGELRQRLDAGGVDYEFYEYDAGHAFTNPLNTNYNKTIAELSVGRMIDFMNKHLA